MGSEGARTGLPNDARVSSAAGRSLDHARPDQVLGDRRLCNFRHSRWWKPVVACRSKPTVCAVRAPLALLVGPVLLETLRRLAAIR
jgi:hypothetical protein